VKGNRSFADSEANKNHKVPHTRALSFSVTSLLSSTTHAQRLAPPTAMAGLALYASIQDAHAKEAAVDMNKVREAIVEVVDTDAEKRGDGTSLAGTFIRLAWHWYARRWNDISTQPFFLFFNSKLRNLPGIRQLGWFQRSTNAIPPRSWLR
jgi:hypothetical protein